MPNSEFVIFYTPTLDNEISSFNSHSSTSEETVDKLGSINLSTVMAAAGHVKVVLTDVGLQEKIYSLGRNSKVVLTDDVVTDIVAHTNSIQPASDTVESWEDQINVLKARIEILEAG